jgi:hypothetical protein
MSVQSEQQETTKSSHTMTFKQAVTYLIDNGYLVVVANQVVVTSKLTKALKLPEITTVNSVVTSEQVLTPQEVVKNEALKPTKKDTRAVWDQFIIDADVPWRVKTNTGETYTIRQYGTTAANQLLKIINDPEVDYNVLVESTKHYYRNTTYKTILSNYILNHVWKEEYREYLKGTHKIGNQGNNFED